MTLTEATATHTRFPMLYKLSSKGKLMQWEIKVEPHENGSAIVVEYGQVDGKLQTTTDVITEGKNQGKANETSIFEQARREAESKWKKQKDKGYVEDKEMATAGKDELQGFKAMLAHPYEDQGHKITWPCAIQPKLDGIRCLAVLKDGECQLFSRNGKRITALPHIEKQLLVQFANQDPIFLDGELYNHNFKDNFEKIVSLVRQQEPDPEHHLVEYHIYDVNDSADFLTRFDEAFKASIADQENIIKVETYVSESFDDAHEKIETWMKDGYEGGILRNIHAPYEGKRSKNLQKFKIFKEEEFKITGYEEGRGKLSGHVSAFWCQTQDGKEFKAKMEGSLERLKAFFEDHSLWQGKILTVKFDDYTAKGKPRFPIGKEIRDYE